MSYLLKNSLFMFVSLCLLSSCIGVPRLNKAQFKQHYYTITILSDPRRPKEGPQMEISLSLLRVLNPKDKAVFLNDLLYAPSVPEEGEQQAGSIGEYKDRIVIEKRNEYRNAVFSQDAIENSRSFNWRYSEAINVVDQHEKGLVLERVYYSYTGGAHGIQLKKFYVIDMELQKIVKIDDLFDDFQGEAVRSVVYKKLREFCGLEEDTPLSQGSFFSDEPELSFNFFLASEGLGLHWDPYEVAPYSTGSIDIIINWKDIRPFMLQSGMELLTKFKIYLFI